MKWLISLLVIVNLLVFVLAMVAKDDAVQYETLSPLKDNTPSISLLSVNASRRATNCINLGPVEQNIVLDRFRTLLNEQSLPYQVISEPQRVITAYRVIISAANIDNIQAVKDQLNAIGIDDVFEKITSAGEPYLSLGVFTYKKTALDFVENLASTGFGAEYKSEVLEYPERHWLNLSQSLDQNMIAQLNDYIGTAVIKQIPAPCL